MPSVTAEFDASCLATSHDPLSDKPTFTAGRTVTGTVTIDGDLTAAAFNEVVLQVRGKVLVVVKRGFLHHVEIVDEWITNTDLQLWRGDSSEGCPRKIPFSFEIPVNAPSTFYRGQTELALGNSIRVGYFVRARLVNPGAFARDVSQKIDFNVVETLDLARLGHCIQVSEITKKQELKGWGGVVNGHFSVGIRLTKPRLVPGDSVVLDASIENHTSYKDFSGLFATDDYTSALCLNRSKKYDWSQIRVDLAGSGWSWIRS